MVHDPQNLQEQLQKYMMFHLQVGFLKWCQTPQIIHFFKGIFHSKPSRSWCSPTLQGPARRGPHSIIFHPGVTLRQSTLAMGNPRNPLQLEVSTGDFIYRWSIFIHFPATFENTGTSSCQSVIWHCPIQCQVSG